MAGGINKEVLPALSLVTDYWSVLHVNDDKGHVHIGCKAPELGPCLQACAPAGLSPDLTSARSGLSVKLPEPDPASGGGAWGYWSELLALGPGAEGTPAAAEASPGQTSCWLQAELSFRPFSRPSLAELCNTGVAVGSPCGHSPVGCGCVGALEGVAGRGCFNVTACWLWTTGWYRMCKAFLMRLACMGRSCVGVGWADEPLWVDAVVQHPAGSEKLGCSHAGVAWLAAGVDLPDVAVVYGVAESKPVPEDPDFDIFVRDEAQQPEVTEAQRSRKALREACAARIRNNSFTPGNVNLLSENLERAGPVRDLITLHAADPRKDTDTDMSRQTSRN
ncbi:hypothetical protein HaLaN_21621 [Haematococcus lacustris]|uniref:Uncharacterized protein n=1 Tax=Haematococcus lacustris TaxID=44745 RepID=A0A699ZYS2_HAELA|nr:hypothetical protein HaLaN_21621 [Haematococcus lacustris]